MLDVFPALAAVFIADPDRKSTGRGEVMTQLYDLSPAEARVAALLSTGREVTEIAGELCVSRETVRTHLKRCFAKTSTATQADLTRVVLLSTPSC